ncbi:prevent-host-death family protein [Prauserella aidingensis]|uniref:type II toxin-antitoxin system Phd/YefM family antitoxin n=1 Tax=Prauserella aidingensis TaxID=387890 RepID=UPI0020A405D2|nr:type II toxin-antitoxin system prevent-host-death family antitoxin [Prauserella aidingensis]MCP2255258.1 prevent-host-death family protein [Prauserella aidingensis]
MERAADTVGLRELRQDASELVRRVEAGAEVTITVAGRPSARLVPVADSVAAATANSLQPWPGPDGNRGPAPWIC